MMTEPETNLIVPVDPVRAKQNANLLRTGGKGRPPGAKNFLQRIVRSRMEELIQSGERQHPALILLDLCNDKNQPPHVRRRSASDLLPYLMPLLQKHSVEFEPPEPADEDRIQSLKRTLAALWVEEIKNDNSDSSELS
jgi:hypothetical protein